MLPVQDDHDFRPEPERGRPVFDPAPEAYLRVLANPFLAATELVAWLIAVRESSAILAVATIPGPFWADVAQIALWIGWVPALILFQYHCLDCGATGRIGRWRRHTCAAVAERKRAGRPLGTFRPSPGVQLLFWLAAVAGFVYLIFLTAPG